MPQNFLCPQRDQQFLMPVDMREWLPEDDLVFVVLDAVATMDLDVFRRSYRADGHGRAAFDPAMMVALLLYGYCQGERSSRVIERLCVRDVGYRVIGGGLHPDHATIARFRARHQEALGGLFSQVLRLLAGVGMVSLGKLSLDGTKLAGNAAQAASRTLPQIEGILAEAAKVDAAEDARYGQAAGEATPRTLASTPGISVRISSHSPPGRARSWAGKPFPAAAVRIDTYCAVPVARSVTRTNSGLMVGSMSPWHNPASIGPVTAEVSGTGRAVRRTSRA